MFKATIETISGDRLTVHHNDGKLGGKAALALFTGLTLYCLQDKGIELTWFAELDAKSAEPICSLVAPIIESWYSGEWGEYSEEDYIDFIHRSGDLSVSEEDFRKTTKEVREKWVDTHKLVVSLEKFIGLLRRVNPKNHEAWYEPEATLDDLDALYKTLLLYAEQSSDRVRINFI